MVFWYQDKGVAIAKDGALCLSDEPDVFIKNDWGNGSFTFQSVRTGKYMNAEKEAEKEGEAAAFRLEIVESGIAKAAGLAAGKNVVILALGCNSMINAKEEVDRTTISLPPAQEALLEEVYQVNRNTVLVLFSNYPYAINSAQAEYDMVSIGRAAAGYRRLRCDKGRQDLSLF